MDGGACFDLPENSARNGQPHNVRRLVRLDHIRHLVDLLLLIYAARGGVPKRRLALHFVQEIKSWTIRNASEITRDRHMAKARYAVCVAARSHLHRL